MNNINRVEDLTKVFDRTWTANHDDVAKRGREKEREFMNKMFNNNNITKERELNRRTPSMMANNLQNKIDSLNNKYKLDRYNKYMNFIEFRKNHYNKEIELLFKKLNLPVFVIDYKDIKQEGTINDYKDYIATEILKGS